MGSAPPSDTPQKQNVNAKKRRQINHDNPPHLHDIVQRCPALELPRQK